jgi:hypothetical protein
MMEAGDNDHHIWVERKFAAFKEIIEFYKRFDELTHRYMRMHQKAPWF